MKSDCKCYDQLLLTYLTRQCSMVYVKHSHIYSYNKEIKIIKFHSVYAYEHIRIYNLRNENYAEGGGIHGSTPILAPSEFAEIRREASRVGSWLSIPAYFSSSCLRPSNSLTRRQRVPSDDPPALVMN